MGTPAQISAFLEEPATSSGGGAFRDARVAGVCAVGSGLLFLARSVLDRGIGHPLGAGPDVVRWAWAHGAGLGWTDEMLFFSTALLIPVVWALYAWLGGARRPWAAFACGLLAVSIPVLFVVGLALGRLVYPVYGIPVTDEQSATAFASLYFGGSHEVALLLCAALIMTGVVLLRTGPRWLAMSTIAAGLGQFAVSYPWLIGPGGTLLCQVVYAAWLVAVGLTLWRLRRLPVPGVQPLTPPAAMPST